MSGKCEVVRGSKYGWRKSCGRQALRSTAVAAYRLSAARQQLGPETRSARIVGDSELRWSRKSEVRENGGRKYDTDESVRLLYCLAGGTRGNTRTFE